MRTDELPDWYGIPGIKFIYPDHYADPELLYKGCIINFHDIEDNFHDIEDMMWDRYTKEYKEPHDEAYLDAYARRFEEYMKEHENDVFELMDDFLRNKEYTDEEIEDLWDDLTDVPMDPVTEKLDSDFFIFKKGTDREDVWKWFDEKYSRGVAKLIYKDYRETALSFDDNERE